jgi:hypothetical protein
VLRDVWTRLQQIAPGQDAQADKPKPQAVPSGTDAPTIQLHDLSHPISLEKSIRAAAGTPAGRLAPHHSERPGPASATSASGPIRR